MIELAPDTMIEEYTNLLGNGGAEVARPLAGAQH